VRMENASGVSGTGIPYLRMFLPDAVLAAGQSMEARLLFRRQPQLPSVSYRLTLLSGQGTP
jgi:hypothetical protein